MEPLTLSNWSNDYSHFFLSMIPSERAENCIRLFLKGQLGWSRMTVLASTADWETDHGSARVTKSGILGCGTRRYLNLCIANMSRYKLKSHQHKCL